MTNGEKADDQVNSGREREESDKRGRRGRLWATIGAPVIVALLAAWLTPLPRYISRAFEGGEAGSRTVSQPLSVAVQDDIRPCGDEWMVNKPLSSIPRAPSSLEPSAWAAWVKVARAVQVRETDAIATIQAKPGQAVFITGIRFDVLKRMPPMRGPVAAPPCGGPLLGRFVDVNLDKSPPQVVQTSSSPQAVVGATALRQAPLRLPYEVSNSDGLVLILYGEVEKTYCIWKADIMWSSNGRSGTFVIDNNGEPFETTPYWPNAPRIPTR